MEYYLIEKILHHKPILEKARSVVIRSGAVETVASLANRAGHHDRNLLVTRCMRLLRRYGISK